MDRMLALLALLVLPATAPGDAPTGEIAGTVLDADQNPIAGAAVMIEGTSTGCMTDAAGRFTLSGLPVGTYALRASSVGYRAHVLTDIIVRSQRMTTVEFGLETAPVGGTVITVRPEYFSENESAPTSSTELSGEQVRRAPGSAGDVVRVITSLPSVAKFDDQYNGLAVRGGNPSETGFYIDGIEIANINHFPRQGTTGGGLGMVNVDLLRDALFMAGGFSAEYGNRLSSVMALDLREGNREEFDAQLDFGMAGMGVVVEGPIADGSGSWLACVRHSWIDLLVDIAEIDAVPTYSDFQGKVVYDLTPSDRLSLVSAGALDYVDYTRDQAMEDGNYNYGITDNYNYLAGVAWRRLWSGGGYSNTSVSLQDIKYGGEYFVTESGTTQALQNSFERALQLRNSNGLQIGSTNLSLGAEGRYRFDSFDNSYAADTNYSGDPIPSLSVRSDRRSFEGGLFASASVPVCGGVTATAGGRLDSYEGSGLLHFSPRGALSCDLADGTNLSAASGLYFQPLPGELLARDPGYSELGDPRALHAVVRLSHLLGDDTRLGIEAYLKEYDGFPYDPGQPEYFILDGLSSEQDLYAFDTLATGGEAASRGLELLLEKKLVSGVYGLVAASLSTSQYRNPGEQWRDRIFDNRFTFTVEGGYKPNRNWEFSLRWVYAGGRPYTPLDIDASAAADRTILDQGRVNAERLPAFHSLNIRADRRINFSGSNLTAYASLWNVYNRRNISAIFWNSIEHRQDEVLQWGLMPVIGLEYEF